MTRAFAVPFEVRLRSTKLGRQVLLLSLSAAVLSLPLPQAVLLAPVLALLTLAASTAAAWLSVRGLAVRSVGARTVQAGQPFEHELELMRAGLGLAPRDLLLLPDGGRAPRLRPIGYAERVERGAPQSVPCVGRLVRRGRERLLELCISSSQPLGLFEARARFRVEVDWLALPRLGSVRHVDDRLSHKRSRRESVRTSPGDEEFYALREHREGDSPQLVHWRSSARRGRTVVRELRGEELPPIELELVGAVRALPASGEPHAGFERAVSVAATLVEHFVRERRDVRFRFAGTPAWRFDVRPSSRDLAALLARLAEVRAVVAPPADTPARGIVVGAGLQRRSYSGALSLDVERRELSDVYSPLRRSELAWSARP